LYEVPNENTIAVITNIVVVNTKDTAERFTIELDGVELFGNTPISAESTISIDIKQVVLGSIEGLASSNLVKVHISGVEIS
jgi:hypothetical protein